MSWLSDGLRWVGDKAKKIGKWVDRDLLGNNPDPRFNPNAPQGGSGGPFVPQGFQQGPMGGDGRNAGGVPFMGGRPDSVLNLNIGPGDGGGDIGYTSGGYGYARVAPPMNRAPGPTEVSAPAPPSSIVQRALGYFTDPEQGLARTYLASQLLGGVMNTYGAYKQGQREDEERERRERAWRSLG